MATITKEILSGSTNGKVILVTGNNSAGAVTVHTAIAGTTNIDLVHLWAVSDATTALTIEYGGTTGPDDLMPTMSIVGNAVPVKVLDGVPLQNSLVIEAFGSATNNITLFGYVNRITV